MSTPSSQRYPDLVAWLQRHHDLDEALARLRRVVPEADLERTTRALRTLTDRLRLHMRQEEDHLIPAYAPLATALPANAAPRVLLADHDRIRGLLDRLEALCDPQCAGDLLQRSEVLSLLTGVLEHHDLRESRWFKPTLDRHVPLSTRRGWLDRFADEEAALPPVLPEVLRPAPPARFTSPIPLEAMLLAVAQDAPPAELWASIPVPTHPKGPRNHAAVQAWVDAVEAAPDLAARRNALAGLADRLRLFGLISPRRNGTPG